jgi:molybdopterin-guanine dinucleotide biosynthesis protein A
MLTLVVQAGGESRRMGSDKGMLPFLGQPLIRRVIDRLAPIADEVLVTTNNPDAYRFLALPLYEDVMPGKGALGGLLTALTAASQPLVAVVACDMPFASAALLSHLAQLLQTGGGDVAIARSAEGLEPLHAVYRRETCLAAACSALERGEMKLISWFPEVQVEIVPQEELAKIDPSPHIFLNLNTPTDLIRAENLAGESQ